jgi:hypothetical protein
MNALARVVHDLVASKDEAGLIQLAAEEQAAIENIRSLISLSPRELARLLAEGELAWDWPAPPPVLSSHIPA